MEKSDWQSIRAAYEAGRHAFLPVESGWQARNPGQQWTVAFDKRGFLATPKEGDWTWGLELRSYGCGDLQHAISGSPQQARASGQRLSYHWDACLEEWFVNDTRGLEHGFTVKKRPGPGDQDEALSFLIASRGSLTPGVGSDGQGVTFKDEHGAAVLTYTGLKVWDADGKPLPSYFEPAAGNDMWLRVNDRDARYPITIDPIAQQAYLKAGNNGDSSTDAFGRSVAVSGNTVVVGAPNEDGGSAGVDGSSNESAPNSGAAYVFVRSGSSWSQQAYLKAINPGPSDNFGGSVSISGDTVVVGASGEDSGTTGADSTPNEGASDSGAAYVYVRSGAQWSYQAYLKASNTGAGDFFGQSVAISENTVVVGAPREDNFDNSSSDFGAAYVFTRTGTSWTQQAYLFNDLGIYQFQFGFSDLFGTSVAVFMDTIVVGSPGEKSASTGVNSSRTGTAFGAGAAYVFTRSGSTWTRQAYLKASNTGGSDSFGISVAVSGDTVAVGASGEDSSTTGVGSAPDNSSSNSGAVYIYARTGTVWNPPAFVKASNTGAGDNFGYSLALSGDTLVVGSPGEDSGHTGVDLPHNESASGAGAGYVFFRSGSSWSQQAYLKASNTGAADSFAFAVGVSGDLVVAGSWGEDGNSASVEGASNENALDAGAVYAFSRAGATWSHAAYVKASNCPSTQSGENDGFGSAVAASGDTVVVGAFGEDTGASGVDSPSDENAPGAGAAYVFVRSGSGWTQQAFLKASNPGMGDGFGRSVSISGNLVVVGAPNEDSSGTGVDSVPNESAGDSGAAYVFERIGTTWISRAYLKASNTGASDNFGYSVAVSSETVIVGAPYEDGSSPGVNGPSTETASSAGAAYVFARVDGAWSQEAYLKGGTPAANATFGRVVAISNETVVVGPKGAHVFTRDGTTWSQQRYLDPSEAGGNSSFGSAIALSGDTLILGSPSDDPFTIYNQAYGAAYIFQRTGTTWSKSARLMAGNYGFTDFFGTSVAISGNTAVVGAPYEDSSTVGVDSVSNNNAADSGAAYVFTLDGATWIQQAYLKPFNTGAGDLFGSSVAISGGVVIVGSPGEGSSSSGTSSTPNDNVTAAGACYTFAGFEPSSPSVGSPSVANVSTAAATLGGEVTGDGGADIIERGVVFSTTASNANPEIGGSGVSKVAVAGTTGSFAAVVTSLTPGTSYTFRAFATNSAGTTYSTVSSFTTVSVHTVTFDPGSHGSRTGGGPLIQTVVHGDAAVAPAITPDTGWIFTGWNGTFDTITNDLTVSALYEPVHYAVTFVVGDHGTRTGGGELTQAVVHGDAAIAPVITSDPGWLFTGWDRDFAQVTSDLTVTALYEPITYTVTFHLGEHGTATGGGLLIQQVSYGNSATAPSVTPNLGWIFNGWNKAFANITEDLAVTATYVEAPRYNVTFDLGTYGTRIGGGDLVQSVVHGGSAEAPHVLAISGQEFTGWDLGLSNITGDVVIHAQYRAWAAYTVTFVLGIHGTRSGGGALSQVIGHGFTAEAPVVTVESGWVLTGWDTPFENVTSDLTITALYSPASCLVTFDPGAKGSHSGGGALNQSVAYGAAAEAPLITPSPGWAFTGWDLPFDFITGDLLVRAVYEASAYTDTFDPTPNAALWAQFEGEVAANTYGQSAGAGSSGNSLWFDGNGTRSATTVPLDVAESDFIRFKIALGNGSAQQWENVDVDQGEGIALEDSIDGVSFTTLGGPFANKTWQEFSFTLPQDAKTIATRFRFRQLAHSSAGFDHWAIDDLVIDHPAAGGSNALPSAVASATVVNAATGTVELNGLLSSDPDGTIATYSWSWSGGVATGGTANATFSSGTTIVTLTVADNLGATASTTVTVQVSDMTSVFQQAGLSGAAAEPGATPFHDGVPNLLKYAFNMNIAGPDVSVLGASGSSGLPLITLDESGPEPVLKVEFLRRKGSGLVYSPERATTLNDFAAMSGSQTITSINSEWERVTVTESNPPQAANSGFARVRVTLP